jgi:hypothetical protein
LPTFLHFAAPFAGRYWSIPGPYSHTTEGLTA